MGTQRALCNSELQVQVPAFLTAAGEPGSPSSITGLLHDTDSSISTGDAVKEISGERNSSYQVSSVVTDSCGRGA